MKLNGLVDIANVVISGLLSRHLFVQICVFEFGSIHKTTLPSVGDVGSERENTPSRWTLTIFQHIVGTRQSTDVKSCTHTLTCGSLQAAD